MKTLVATVRMELSLQESKNWDQIIHSKEPVIWGRGAAGTSGVAQWQEHSPLTNATRVRLPAWEVCELGLRSLSDVGDFLRVYSGFLPQQKPLINPRSEQFRD